MAVRTPSEPGSSTSDVSARPVAGDHSLALLALLAVVVVLWWPFGLRVGPTFEEWKALYWSDEAGGVPMMFLNRPLVFGPYTLAHLLGQPLLALNLMQAGAILVRGALVYLLVLRLVPGAAGLGFLAAVLSIVHPADQGFFTLRKVMLHLAVALDLVAIHLLLSLARGATWWLLAPIAACQAVSLALDIPSIPWLLAAPALAAWYAWPPERAGRRFLARTAAWSVVPLIGLAVNTHSALNLNSYEYSVLVNAKLGPGPARTLAQLADRAVRGGGEVLVGGWVKAIRAWPGSADAWLALAAAGLVVAPMLARLAATGPGPRLGPMARAYGGPALAALLAIPLGYLLFLPSRWMGGSWRIYFHASIGAAVLTAMAVTVAAATASRHRRLVLTVLGTALAAVGLAAGLAQHRGYYSASLGQQRYLSAVVRGAPRLQPGAFVLVVDTPPYPGRLAWRTCTQRTECLELTLRYLYGRRDLEAAYCAFGAPAASPLSETCRFDAEEVVVTYRNPWGDDTVVRRHPYRRLVAFEGGPVEVRLLTDLTTYHAGGPAPGYDPAALIDAAARPPPRAATTLTVPVR